MLAERINEDMKQAMRDKDSNRLSAIRLIRAALKQYEVDNRTDLTDQIVISLLAKMIKQRNESIEQYKKADRQDLIDTESFELSVIQSYMPAQLDEQELKSLVGKVITDLNANGIKDMGKVMAQLKPDIEGRADPKLVSQMVKEQLGA